jgi:serine/threonine-protein kinase
MAENPDRTAISHDNASESAAPPEDYSGRVLDDFELVRRIGVGGMGQVYLARQRSLKRQVAIKILKDELAANVAALRRFNAEAEAVANITHAHIVQVYTIGEDQGLHYMALEYVDGRNLRDFILKKGLPDLPLAIEIMRQVASGLERAGELGFVHRDIKPENILLSKKGEVKITDFGLSRCFGTDAPLNLTQTGLTMGTPLYMSPEQVRGQPVDPRSDIYSFGVTCYHMLAGEPPFKGSAAFDVAIQHVQREPRPLGSIRPDLPPELCAIVHRMMAKRPEDRYQSAREILADLDRLRGGAGLAVGSALAMKAYAAALGNSSTHVPAVSASASMTHPLAPAGGMWRYAVVAVLAAAAAAGGAALHWAQTPPPSPTPDPNDALMDVDPSPAALREKELRKQISDKGRNLTFVIDDLLELAHLLIQDRRFDEAKRLFEKESLNRLGAFTIASKDKRDQELADIVSRLGIAIVLAYQDLAEPSNNLFREVALAYPPIAKKSDVPPKLRPARSGQLEQFFNREESGPNWKRAVGEALERNAKNLDGRIPDDLRRLRMLPVKGPFPRSKSE